MRVAVSCLRCLSAALGACGALLERHLDRLVPPLLVRAADGKEAIRRAAADALSVLPGMAIMFLACMALILKLGKTLISMTERQKKLRQTAADTPSVLPGRSLNLSVQFCLLLGFRPSGSSATTNIGRKAREDLAIAWSFPGRRFAVLTTVVDVIYSNFLADKGVHQIRVYLDSGRNQQSYAASQNTVTGSFCCLPETI